MSLLIYYLLYSYSFFLYFSFFFFNDTATTEIYTLSLHDALPIYEQHGLTGLRKQELSMTGLSVQFPKHSRSEEHTSELQSQSNLVCRLLLEKKKKKIKKIIIKKE